MTTGQRDDEKMPEDSATTITNADTISAMANPVRMRILGTLRINGMQTVGSISKQLEQAPGAISYHLKQLQRAGLVEQAESPDGDHRKSWWRACQNAIRLETPRGENSETQNPDQQGQLQATDQFRRSAALSYEMAYERFLDQLSQLPQEWTDSCTSEDHVLHMTAEEMSLMVSDLRAVIHNWQQKTRRKDNTVTKTEPVAVIIQAFRWVP